MRRARVDVEAAARRHRSRVNGVPRTATRAGPPAALRLPAPRPRPHRHPRRLRARRLRRLHGAGRRPADAVVPDVRREAAGARGHHGRGIWHDARRRPEPGAAGLRRVPRPPVRLLHTGLRHDDHRVPRGEPRPDARGGPRGDLRATCAAAPATRTSSRPSVRGRRDPPRGSSSSSSRRPATRPGRAR